MTLNKHIVRVENPTPESEEPTLQQQLEDQSQVPNSNEPHKVTVFHAYLFIVIL